MNCWTTSARTTRRENRRNETSSTAIRWSSVPCSEPWMLERRRRSAARQAASRWDPHVGDQGIPRSSMKQAALASLRQAACGQTGPSYPCQQHSSNLTSGHIPMEARNRFGVLSVFFGIAGFLATIGYTELQRARIPGFGHLLSWMDRLGLVNAPPAGQLPEWRSRGLLDLTDDRVLQWTFVYSVCFAIWSILMALLAEYKCEESSSLSLGFILGALALYLHGFEYGMFALLSGGAILVLIRRGRPSLAGSGDV
jgi:hypothetical protein